MVIKGKQRGYIPGRGRQVVGRCKTLIVGSHPRGTYSQDEIDDMLTERDHHAKAQKREIDLLKSGESGSGRGANDHEGWDEDVSRDEDVCGDDDEGCCAAAVLPGVDDMPWGKVFPSLTMFDLPKPFPSDMSSGKVSPFDFI
ncbi:hypothetical protein Tco_1564143 [Tanacetum coccineum]